MATGDITGVEISPSGAEPYGACADITIEGFTTGKAVNFGSGYGSPLAYSDIGSATIVFTVVSEGYTSSGTLSTVTRTLYATEVVRQEYPNEASDEEPAATSIRVALSDFVYDDDNTGAGKSGTAPTVTIAAAAIRNDGGSSETSNATTDLTCTNSSGLDYPQVIARWDRVAGVCTADRVTSAFTMAVRAYHRSGIACVVFDADGQTSSNNETSTATTRTATQRTGSGLYAEAYHSDSVALTSFTDDELIDLRFRAYPVVGDADSVRDSDNHTTVAEECRGYNKATIVCDKDDDSSMFASVDITSGNDATGVVSGTLATAEASPYQHIGAAIEDGANVIYLEDGTHPAIGHTFTRVTTDEWIVVTHHPTNSSKAGAIVQVDTTRNYLTQRLQYKEVTFQLSSTSSWMDGQAVGNFLRFTGVVFDDDTTGAPLTGVGYRSHATYLENCTGDMGEQEWDWRYFSTPHQYYNFDGCDFGTPATPGTSNRACSFEMVACKANTAALRFFAVHASTVLDHLEMSFNEIMNHNSTSTNVVDIANAATGGISIGAAVIGNVIEKTAATSALVQIAADNGGYDCNNILLFHNTFAGERINAGYNSSGSTALIRRNWAQKYNSFEEWNVKTDTFAPENANRTGNWPIVYGVGFLGNQYETTLFAGDYDGLDTQIGSAGYTDDNSETTDSSGNGDYTPAGGSALLQRIPSGQRVVTIDLYGSPVADGGDIGAIQVTSPGGMTGWVEFASASGTSWTDPSNALTSLSTAATWDIASDATTNVLSLTNASTGLSAVTGTVTAIDIRVEATGENDGTKEIEDATVQLIIEGSQVGSNLAVAETDWSDSSIVTRDYYFTGLSYTAAQVKATNSGVALAFKNYGTVDALMSVYRVQIRVTYDAGATGTGALTGPVGTVAGAGAQTDSGTGALTGPVGTVAGAGDQTHTGTGALTGPLGTVSGAGTQTHDGTGALTGPVGTVAGVGVTGNDRTGTGALTGPAGVVIGFGLAGKTGTGALTGPVGTVAGAGAQTDSGTGALTGPVGIVNGTGLNSPPNVAGTGALTGPVGTVAGIGFALIPSAVTGDSLKWYLTGASQDNETQRDPHASLGGYRSSQRAELMTWDCRNPMVGIEILAVSGGNGRGTGSLEAATTGSLTWTPPNGEAGAAVTIAEGEEKTLFGFGTGAWIRVKRVSDVDLVGAHSVACVDCYNNMVGMENVPHADAVAGEVYYRALICKNEAEYSLATLQVWIGSECDGDIAIAYETPSSGAIQTIADETTAPTGLTWNTGTTAATGLQITSLAAGESLGIWIRRTIATDAAPSPGELTDIEYTYTNTVDDLDNALRGKYRIARTDYVMDGVWIGEGAEPDLTAAPDETFTSRPHTTSLALSAGEKRCVVRTRNKYGLWSQNSVSTKLILNASGGTDPSKPTDPSDVRVGQNSDDEPVITARYEPAVDGDARAEIFVVWWTEDGTDPDPAVDTPSAYQLMNGRFGIELLDYTDTGNSLLDGTPVRAVVRSRRVVVGDGDSFSPDTTQLAASGAGTIVVATELTNWASTGFLKVLDSGGILQEIVEYDSLVVGGGISTFTVLAGGRAQWGTTAAATTTTSTIYEVTYTDSESTTVVEGVIDALAPGRAWGGIFFGTNGKQVQEPIAGPDGVTKEYIDVGNNIYLLLGEGWAELYIDTTMVWKCFADSNVPTLQVLYIPSEWDLVADTISAAASGTDVFENTSATDLYMVVGGTRRVHIDATAMTITAEEFWSIGGLPDKAPQATTWRQYAGALATVWDPGKNDYRPFLQLTTGGALKCEFDINNSLAQSAVEAL